MKVIIIVLKSAGLRCVLLNVVLICFILIGVAVTYSLMQRRIIFLSKNIEGKCVSMFWRFDWVMTRVLILSLMI